MQATENAWKMIKFFEGLRLRSYLDSAGVPTIGYGHTKGVRLGMKCDEAMADVWLEEDITEAEKAANQLITVDLKTYEFDAIIDFIFNFGYEKFLTSTLLKKINLRDQTASKEFPRWNKEHDRNGILRSSVGLTRRREAEKVLFETGVFRLD